MEVIGLVRQCRAGAAAPKDGLTSKPKFTRNTAADEDAF